MNWLDQDWEREAELDAVYAQERQSLMEQEYFEYENKRKPAKIIYKKHGNKNNTPSLSRIVKKRTQLGRDIPAKISKGRKKH